MAKISDVVDVNEDEVTTSLPENAGGEGSHGDIRNAAMDEAVENASLESSLAELASKEGDLNVSELRTALGEDAKGVSDEDLEKLWKEAQAGEDGTETPDPKQVELPFPIYDAKGNKVTDVSKVTMQDFLSGKYQVGYNALGKEQRKAFQELVRNASLGHYNEQKMTTVQSERQRAMEMLTELRKEHESWGSDRKTWDRVLLAYTQGNAAPLEQLIRAYVTEMGKAPSAVPEGSVSQQDMELERRGQEFINDTIVPHAYQLAQEYGADFKEIKQAILKMVQDEPAEFLTREKVDNIMNHEIVVMLENSGYTKNGVAATKPALQQPTQNDEVAELRKELAAVKAAQENATTNRVRNKLKKAPSAGGGSVSSAGDNMPNFKNRNEMKKYLRGENE